MTPRVYERIQNKSFWFSRMSELNDPFEADFGVTDFKAYIQAKLKHINGIETDEDRARVIADHRKAKKRQFLVYSATKDPSIPLLWSHYADSHRGVCIEIEVDDSISPQDLTQLPGNCIAKEVVRPVTYSDENLFLSESTVKSLDIVYRKHTDWSYEKELRIVLQSDKDYPNQGYHLSDNAKIRYIGITLGMRFPDKDYDDISNACQQTGIKLSHAVQGHGRHRILIQ